VIDLQTEIQSCKRLDSEAEVLIQELVNEHKTHLQQEAEYLEEVNKKLHQKNRILSQRCEAHNLFSSAILRDYPDIYEAVSSGKPFHRDLEKTMMENVDECYSMVETLRGELTLEKKRFNNLQQQAVKLSGSASS